MKKTFFIISFIIIFLCLIGVYLGYNTWNNSSKTKEQAKTELPESSEKVELEETAFTSANTNLITLAIENTLLDKPFSPEITSYEAEVSNRTDSLNILAIPEDENAKVEIQKEEALNIGNNLVKIIVTDSKR